MNLAERRSAPRFEVSLSGTVAKDDGHLSNIQVSNISSSGLQFVVAQHEIPTLLPNISSTNTMSPVQVTLTIELADNEPPLTIKCGIVYLQRKSLVQCFVGCRFEEFLDQGHERLESYIINLGRAAEPRFIDKK